jgi:hypothetical protein
MPTVAWRRSTRRRPSTWQPRLRQTSASHSRRTTWSDTASIALRRTSHRLNLIALLALVSRLLLSSQFPYSSAPHEYWTGSARRSLTAWLLLYCMCTNPRISCFSFQVLHLPSRPQALRPRCQRSAAGSASVGDLAGHGRLLHRGPLAERGRRPAPRRRQRD